MVLRGRRMRVAVGVAAAAVVVAGASTAYALTARDEESTARTSLVAVETGDVTLAVAATGTLAPAQTRSLSFGTSSTVTAVNVRTGDVVKAGDVLAEVDKADAQEKVDKATEELASAQEALSTASSSSTSSTDTSCVADTGGGAVYSYATIGTTPTPSPSAPAGGDPAPTVTVTVTETVTVYVTVTASPSESPSASPSASPSQSPSTGPTPTRSPSGGGSTGPSTGGGSNGGSNGSTGGGSTGDSCGSTGGSGGTGGTGSRSGGGDAVYNAETKVTSAKKALEEAEDALAGAVLKAPIGGKILSVAGGIGTKVSSGSTFVSLGDVGGMEVQASFPEADAGRLEVGQIASVTLADRPGETFAATVTQVDPVGTATDSMVTYGALISFDTVPEDLLVGQNAQATVTISAVAGVLRVPASAVRDVNGGNGVVTVRANGVDEQRTVRVGLVGDAYAEITSGVAAGETVVAG
ncbi:efflux RND transporter periplasmic adaptor subunit [Catenuloplanes japonicus]|uniref:efflux RND transporter periplasmic adaptor subunit n=1 Tax=Catenuloplanes japonicus TaxID=33876 RepID=UPI001E301DB9|nr:efflux RND transporter periplasmic adaptor subunit [Catenuloplanes japonicus]